MKTHSPFLSGSNFPKASIGPFSSSNPGKFPEPLERVTRNRSDMVIKLISQQVVANVPFLTTHVFENTRFRLCYMYII